VARVTNANAARLFGGSIVRDFGQIIKET